MATPFITQDDRNENRWVYNNGCVRRDNLFLSKAAEKVQRFNKNPQRHLNFFNKNNKCLGLDVSYDAYFNDKTYRHGCKFIDESTNITYMLCQVLPGKCCLINISSEGDPGNRHCNPIHVKNCIGVTREELKEMCGSSINIENLR